MMLWEHVVVGYVGYSVFVHVVYGDAPDGRGTIAVVLGSAFPDLLDKPLAWEFGVFQAGYGVAHSAFVAVPLAVMVGVLLSGRGRPRFGWAFGIGYLLHLPADVLPEYLLDGRLVFQRILWPLHAAERPHRHGFLEGIVQNVGFYADQVQNPASPSYMIAINAVMIVGILLWIYDGMPAVR